jgi:hypothetical protein
MTFFETPSFLFMAGVVLDGIIIGKRVRYSETRSRGGTHGQKRFSIFGQQGFTSDFGTSISLRRYP